MKFLSSVLALGAILDASLAAPSPTIEARACTSPKIRKEWSKATTAERSSYINAVKCLTTKPSKLGKPHRLYDDFVWVHANLFQYVHNVAAFLPWHRYFLTLYEQSLQQCGYTGNILYWDWVAAADTKQPSKAKVFDPVTGFGGNGNVSATQWENKCVLDGPFKKGSLTLRYWNVDVRPHCLIRVFEPGYPEYNITEMIADNYNSAAMAYVNAETTFENFANALENGPHTAVHQGVGNLDGDMGPQSSSPNDPLFFLHHAQVDRLWYLWQNVNPARKLDYSGYTYPNYTAATLNDLLPMLGLGVDKKVRDYMDVNAANLCYKY